MLSPSINRILAALLLACVSGLYSAATERPSSVFIGGQTHHVQGIAYDEAAGEMYFSFTTRFLATDFDGNIVGSIDKIHGHLGAMTFDAARRKIYASLECKDDEIGANISRKLGVAGYSVSRFYIAEIDVDAVNRMGTPQEEAIRLISVAQAAQDYSEEVEYGGRRHKHRYGCTGIDGITIGPGFGGKGGEFLYVAYGIKSDTTRTDNDYQILLQYPMKDIRAGGTESEAKACAESKSKDSTKAGAAAQKCDKAKACAESKGKDSTEAGAAAKAKKLRPQRYFIRTGNTRYGVQNLAWDAYSGLMFLAVYKGEKKQWPNYDLFAVNMNSKPRKARLEGVPYERRKMNVVELAGDGWRFKYGSMGLCPLGDGTWYIAEGGKTKVRANEGNSTDGSAEKGKIITLRTGKAVLYRWTPDADKPFTRVSMDSPVEMVTLFTSPDNLRDVGAGVFHTDGIGALGGCTTN